MPIAAYARDNILPVCIVRHGTMLFSSFFFLSRSEAVALFVRGVHSSNKNCVDVYRPISTRFSAFFSKVIAISGALHCSHFVASWRHNFREIAVKNFEKSKNLRKSLCARLRIDIREI